MPDGPCWFCLATEQHPHTSPLDAASGTHTHIQTTQWVLLYILTHAKETIPSSSPMRTHLIKARPCLQAVWHSRQPTSPLRCQRLQRQRQTRQLKPHQAHRFSWETLVSNIDHSQPSPWSSCTTDCIPEPKYASSVYLIQYGSVQPKSHCEWDGFNGLKAKCKASWFQHLTECFSSS